MSTFLHLALSDFLWPMLWWSAVFILAAGCCGGVVIWWLFYRIRGLSQRGIRMSRGRVILTAFVVSVLSVVVPCLIAFVHAVPFSVQRSLAVSIEKSAPIASDWLVDFSTGHVARLLHVSVDDRAIDVSAMSERVSSAAKALRDGGRPDALLDRLTWLAARESLDVLEESAAELPGAMSWRDLVQTTKSLMRTRLSWLTQDVIVSLEVAAIANVYAAVAQVVGCNALSILLVLVAVRLSSDQTVIGAPV